MSGFAILQPSTFAFACDGLTVVPPGVQRPQFTIQQANQILVKALRPFGQEWYRELTALLNPSNGRLDIAPGNNRGVARHVVLL